MSHMVIGTLIIIHHWNLLRSLFIQLSLRITLLFSPIAFFKSRIRSFCLFIAACISFINVFISFCSWISFSFNWIMWAYFSQTIVLSIHSCSSVSIYSAVMPALLRRKSSRIHSSSTFGSLSMNYIGNCPISTQSRIASFSMWYLITAFSTLIHFGISLLF